MRRKTKFEVHASPRLSLWIVIAWVLLFLGLALAVGVCSRGCDEVV